MKKIASAEKFSRIQSNIKKGVYADLASARKSISKTQGLSEAEQESLRKSAERKFKTK